MGGKQGKGPPPSASSTPKEDIQLGNPISSSLIPFPPKSYAEKLIQS